MRLVSAASRRLKRNFDALLSFSGLFMFGWLILFAFVIACIETRSFGFFIQKRVGLHGKTFRVIKIKTMKKVSNNSTTVTTSNDTRITKSGHLFRKLKIDELPQLFNVLKGDMSFVGPRPDVEGYADKLQGEDRIILTVRPGITGPATLYYRNEEEILAAQDDPEKYNSEVIYPHKTEMNKHYIKHYTFLKDLYYIFKTIV